MSVILLILQIIAALPSLISTIKEIIDLIKGTPKETRGQAYGELREILMAAQKDGFVGGAHAHRLEQFLERLRSARRD